MTLQGFGRLVLLSVLLPSSGCMLFLMKYQGVDEAADTGAIQPPASSDADGDADTDDTAQVDVPEPTDSGNSSDSGVGSDSGGAEEVPIDTGATEDTGGASSGSPGDTGSTDDEPPICHDTGAAG